MVFDAATQQWTTCKQFVGNGQHALVEYHPAHDATLIVGGNTTDSVAQVIDQGGARTPAPPYPSTAKMKGAGWIVPHKSGMWLVRSDDGVVYGWAPGMAAWRAICAAPDQGCGYPTAAYDAERDAVLIIHTKGLAVWRCPEIVP
jgi:hypothetical protein